MTEKELTAHELAAHELAIELLERGKLLPAFKLLGDSGDIRHFALLFLARSYVPEKAYPTIRTALIKFITGWFVDPDEKIPPIAIEALRKFKAVPELRNAFLESEKRANTLKSLLKGMGEEIPEREKKNV